MLILVLLGIFSLSFLFSCVLTPLARHLAGRWGLVDNPDSRRKMHAKPIPVAGGIAVLASAIIVMAGVFFIPNPLQQYLAGWSTLLVGLLLATLLLCFLGVLDDCHCLRGRTKLMGQIVAVGIVIACNVQVHSIHIFAWKVELGILAIPFTAFWLLGAINSLNLIDGMDGLLGSVAVIISVAMGIMAVLGGHWTTACVAMTFAGALVGFLRYNLPPATIFLGDAGSMVIGLVIGVLGIQSSLKAPATIALIAPLAALAIPIFDTSAAIIRRKLTGQSIYATDRGHMHHCFLRRGFSPWVTLLLISSCCLLTVLGALASLALENELMALVSVLVVAAILIVTRLFGHAELLLVVQRFMLAVRSLLPGTVKGHKQFEMRLQGTASWEGLMKLVTAPGHQLNLLAVSLEVNAPALHEAYHAKWYHSEQPHHEEEEACLWNANLPLAVHGHVVGRLKVVGRPDSHPIPVKIATLLSLMKEFEGAMTTSTSATVGPHWKLQKRETKAHLSPDNPVHTTLNIKDDTPRPATEQKKQEPH